MARAQHIICISESTRRDLIELLDVAPHKITTTYLGFTTAGKAPQRAPDRNLIGKPYLLYVGERRGYKNFRSLVRAYAASARLRRDFALLAVGGGGFRDDEVELIRAEGLSIGVDIFQAALEEEHLAQTYADASVFVYPSLYEGFGIPPLEAMSQGCPVISSNRSSLPEVVGAAALSFGSDRADELTTLIETAAYSDSIRSDLIQKGHAQCAKFSWDQCAKETLMVYSRLTG